MSSESDQQAVLEFNRGGLLLMAVILVVTWLGSEREGGDSTRQPLGHAFGAWTRPAVTPVLEKTARCEVLGIGVDAIEGFSFFLVDRPGDGVGPSTIALINRKRAILGEIQAFESSSLSWPPKPTAFGFTVDATSAPEGVEGIPQIDVSAPDDFRLQVQTVLYGETRVTWTSPRKSPAWPLRIHRAKCEVGDKTLMLSIYELHAESPEPDYEDGPLAAIASALRPI